MINAVCQICGNSSSYDEDTLKESTWTINGCEIVLCCPCEDNLKAELINKLNPDFVEEVAHNHNYTTDGLQVMLEALSDSYFSFSFHYMCRFDELNKEE